RWHVAAHQSHCARHSAQHFAAAVPDRRGDGEYALMTLVIAGGGTAGPLHPGIAVAQDLLRRMPDSRISFVGTARGLEARVIPKEGFELDLIRSAGIKGKSWTA